MRLKIDSEAASSSCVGRRFAAPTERDGIVLLDVQAQEQGLPNWCWAAITSMIGTYYVGCGPSQIEVAARLLGLDARLLESDETTRHRADAEMRLDAAMALVDCYSHWSAGKPVFDRVRFEINLGRPFAARIGWHAGAAHYVLVHGYRDDGRTVVVADPLHGPGEYAFADFPSAYRLGGAWTETFWTNSPDGAERRPETTIEGARH